MHTIVEQINTWGQGFIDFAVAMGVQSSFLILVLLGLNFVLRNKIRAIVRYGLLLLILVKLVLPVSLSLPTGLGYWLGDKFNFASAPVPASDPAEAIASDALVPSRVPENPVDPAIAESATTAPAFPDTEGIDRATPVLSSPAAQPVMITWQGIAFLLWLVIVTVMAALLLQKARFVNGLVAQAAAAPEHLRQLLKECRAELGLRQQVSVKISPNTATASVCGLARPVVLIPENLTQLESIELRAVLLHELSHVKRGDLWINLIQTLLQIIYFYNPLLWLANAAIRTVREQAVDEMVLVAMGDQADKYSDTLLNVAKMALATPHFSLRLIGVVESKKALKQRIKHILQRPWPKSAKVGIVGLIVMVGVACVLLPMARGSISSPQETREEKNDRESAYRKILSSGLTVELLGICDHLSEGKTWWKPDGMIMAESMHPYDEFDGTSSAKGYSIYELAIQLSGPASESASAFVPEIGCGQTKYGKGKIRLAFKALPEKQTLDFKVGVGSGVWRTHSEAMKSKGVSSYGNPELVVYGKPFEEDGMSWMTISHSIDENIYETKIVAVNSRGEEIKSGRQSSIGNDSFTQATCGFDVPLEDVTTFRLQTREYEWVEFENVALRPDDNWTYDLEGPDSLHFKSSSARVVDTRGRPIVGARIAFHQRISLSNDKRRTQQKELPWEGGATITDAKGRFPIPRLPVPDDTVYASYDAKISAVGFLERDNVVLGPRYGNDTGVIELHEPGSIGGVLLGQEGQPVAKASVALRSRVHYRHPDSSCSGCYDDEVVTDDEGYFRFENVPPGNHYLRYPGNSCYDIDVPAEGCVGLEVELAESKVVDGLALDLAQSTATLQGKIVDENNQPIEGAYVYLATPLKSHRSYTLCSHVKHPTQADGRYQLDHLPPGDWLVRASYPYVKNQRQITSSPTPIRLNPDETTVQDITLGRREESKQQTNKPATSNGKWDTALTNGANVELVGLCEHPSEGKQWWSSDGSVIDPVPSVATNITGSRFADTPGYKRYKIVLQVLGSDLDHIGTTCQLLPQTNRDMHIMSSVFNWGGRRGRNERQLEHIVEIRSEFDHVSMRYGFAGGSWKTVHSAKDVAAAEGNSVRLIAIKEKAGQTRVDALDPSHYKLAQTRLVAIGKDNQDIGALSVRDSVDFTKEERELRYHFDAPLNDIKEFQFQTRPYEWVEFRNVLLKPGHKTEAIAAGRIPSDLREVSQGTSHTQFSVGEIIESVKKAFSENEALFGEAELSSPWSYTYTIDANDIPDEEIEELQKRMVDILTERLGSDVEFKASGKNKIEVSLPLKERDVVDDHATGSVENMLDPTESPIIKSDSFPSVLPYGMAVEIVGLSEHPSEGKPWWGADGAVLEERPYVRLKRTFVAAEYVQYELVYRVEADAALTKLAMNNYVKGTSGPHPLITQVENIAAADAENLHVVIVSCPAQLDAAELTFLVGSESKWRADTQLDGAEMAMTSVNGPGAMISSPIEKEGRTYVHIAHSIVDQEYRVVAFDGDGNMHKAGTDAAFSPNKGMGAIEADFDLSLDQIKSIEFQTQHFTRVEFKNVSLKPRPATDAKAATANSGELMSGTLSTISR